MFIQKEFLFKSFVRFMHIFGVVVLSGIIISEYFFYQDSKAQNQKLRNFLIVISVVMLIAGGTINLIILKKFKENCDKKYYRIYAILTHMKLLLTVLIFSPIGKILMKKEMLETTKLVLVLLFVCVGVFTKNLRELSPKYSEKNQRTI